MFGHVKQIADGFAHAINHCDGVRVAALLKDRQVDRALAIHAHHVGLNRRRILRLTHIRHSHAGLAHGLDRQCIDGLQIGKLAVGVDVVVVRPNAHIAGRQNQVGIVDRAHHVHEAKLVRFQFVRIDVDHDLPVFAAERLRHRRARHARNLIAHLELCQIM